MYIYLAISELIQILINLDYFSLTTHLSKHIKRDLLRIMNNDIINNIIS